MLKALSVELKTTKECTGIQATGAKQLWTPEKANVVRPTVSEALFTTTMLVSQLHLRVT
jgi:hypothetical protein